MLTYLLRMDKKYLRKFDVKIQSLSNNEHSFVFEFNQALLEHFSDELEMKNTFGDCKVNIIKTDMMLETSFLITGSTELTCDRTLKKFTYSLDLKNKILFKFGGFDEEISEDMIVIDRNKSIINIANYIYEFVILKIPAKRLHPSLKNEDNIDNFVFRTNAIKKTDPRLDPLNKLK